MLIYIRTGTNNLQKKIFYSDLIYSSCATACCRVGRIGLGWLLRDQIFLDFMQTPLLHMDFGMDGMNFARLV